MTNTTTATSPSITYDPANYTRSQYGQGYCWRKSSDPSLLCEIVQSHDPDFAFAHGLTYVPAPKGHPDYRTSNYVAAEVASLAVECAECGAEPGQPCEWSCTAQPSDHNLMVEAYSGVPADADSSPVLVRASVTSPSGQTYVVYGGEVPAWLWDDPKTRETWKREHRPYVLSQFHPKPTHARGFRVEWEAWEPVDETPKGVS
jgi:hypothetical protein